VLKAPARGSIRSCSLPAASITSSVVSVVSPAVTGRGPGAAPEKPIRPGVSVVTTATGLAVVIVSAPVAIVIPTVVVAAAWRNHGREALPHRERPPWTAMAMAQLVRYNNCGNLKLMLPSQLTQQQ
jgi:hypothetical protein